MRGRRFGSALRYHLWSDSKGLWIYYLCIVAAGIALGVFSRCRGETWGSFEAATAIFLFVSGLHAFRERFFLFLQHGFSRKTLLGSFLLSALLFCLALAAADTALWLLHSTWSDVRSLFQQIYAARAYGVSVLSTFLTFVWNYSFYLFTYLLGYLVGCLYYPMSRPGKLLFTVAVPAVVVLGVPAMNASTHGATYAALQQAGRWLLYGQGVACPWCGMRSFALGAVVLAALSALFVCRAALKRS